MAFATNNLQAMILSRAEFQPTAEVSSGPSPSRLPANSAALSAFEVLFTQQLAAQLSQLASTSTGSGKDASTGSAPTASSNLPSDLHKPFANDDNTAIYSLLNPLLLSQTPSSLPKFNFSLDGLLSGTNSRPAATEKTSGESSDVTEATPLGFDSSETEFRTTSQSTFRSAARSADEPVAAHLVTSIADNQAPAPTQFNQTLDQITSVDAQIAASQAQPVTAKSGNRSTNSPMIEERTSNMRSAVSAEHGANIDVSQFESLSLHVRAQDLPLPVQKPLMNLSEPNFVNANIAQIERSVGDLAATKKPSIADELAAEIERQIRNADEPGPTTVEIRLERPVLGRVRVTLSLRGKSVAVRIAVETPEAQRLINSHLSSLQQSLASSGIDCNEVVVGCDDSLTDDDRSTESKPVAGRREHQNQTRPAPPNERSDRLSFVA